jgi:hypothetical protein
VTAALQAMELDSHGSKANSNERSLLSSCTPHLPATTPWSCVEDFNIRNCIEDAGIELDAGIRVDDANSANPAVHGSNKLNAVPASFCTYISRGCSTANE